MKPLRYHSAPLAPSTLGKREERPALGIGLGAISYVTIACADTISKVAAAVLPAPQIIFIRAVFIMILLSPMFWRAARAGDAPWRTAKFGLHMVRSALQITAMLTFLMALRHMPLTTVVTIQFLAPLLVAVFAALFLKEKLGWPQLGPILLGFAGCLIILRPGTDAFSFAAILAITCAISWALVLVLLRSLTATESASTILFWQNATQVVSMALAAPFVWVSVPEQILWLLFGLAVMQSLGQWLSAKAMSYAPAATIAPLQYSMLIWITLLGWFVFGEWPGPHVWLGAAIIIASGLWLMRVQRGASGQR